MNASAVILREMRAEARRPSTYWLRVALGGLLLLAATVTMMGQFGAGAIIFGGLNALLFISIWVLVPLLTADCISRERREGTLGLLFLTPLRAPSIIVAKGFVHTLRGCSYLLTALPALTIPFLLGGVSARDLGRAALLDLSAVLLALAAGLQVSALSVRWSRALIAAELLSLCVALSFAAWHQWLMRVPFGGLEDQWELITGVAGKWAGNVPRAGLADGLTVAAKIFGISAALLACVICFAGYRLRRSWQEEPLSRGQVKLIRIFCTPLFWRKFFTRKQARALDKNPIGWLQQYSWSARLCRWGWCMGMVVYACMLATAWTGSFSGGQVLPILFMIGAIAFTASGSFARERQNGAMELLLVSPLTVGQIIWGRWRGIVSQFIPAAGVWLLCFFFLNSWDSLIKEAWWAFIFASTGVTCGFVGLYFSICRFNFIAAWCLTLALAVGVPFLLGATGELIYAVFFLDIYSASIQPQNLFSIIYITTQAQLCRIALRSLRHGLTRRNFSFV